MRHACLVVLVDLKPATIIRCDAGDSKIERARGAGAADGIQRFVTYDLFAARERYAYARAFFVVHLLKFADFFA